MSENYNNNNNNNIFPEKIIKTTGQDGKTYTSEVYSFEAWGNLGLFGIIFYGLIIAAFLPFVSALFLLFFCFGCNIRPIPNSHNLFGLISSIYILLDLHFKWLFHSYILSFFEPDTVKEILYVNLGLIIVHGVLLIMAIDIFSLVKNSKLGSIVIILLMSVLAYYFSRFLIDSKILKII